MIWYSLLTKLADNFQIDFERVDLISLTLNFDRLFLEEVGNTVEDLNDRATDMTEVYDSIEKFKKLNEEIDDTG